MKVSKYDMEAIPDPILDDEIKSWENEGGATIHAGDTSEPQAESDDAEEG